MDTAVTEVRRAKCLRGACGGLWERLLYPSGVSGYGSVGQVARTIWGVTILVSEYSVNEIHRPDRWPSARGRWALMRQGEEGGVGKGQRPGGSWGGVLIWGTGRGVLI